MTSNITPKQLLLLRRAADASPGGVSGHGAGFFLMARALHDKGLVRFERALACGGISGGEVFIADAGRLALTNDVADAATNAATKETA